MARGSWKGSPASLLFVLWLLSGRHKHLCRTWGAAQCWDRYLASLRLQIPSIAPQRSGEEERGEENRALLSAHKTMTIAHPLMRRWILILFKARLLRFLFWMLIYANEEEIKQVLFVVVERFFPLASHFNMNFMAICVFVEIRWEFRTSFQPKQKWAKSSACINYQPARKRLQGKINILCAR